MLVTDIEVSATAILDGLQSSDDPHTVEWAHAVRDHTRALFDGG